MLTLLEILKLSKHNLIEKLQSLSVIEGEDYWLLYTSPALPLLVAHVDTVYDSNPLWDKRDILHQNGFYWSPYGIGGDDRCGVYALLSLYNQGFKANYLFTDYEEQGGVGAINASICQEIQDSPYAIEIDRQGHREAVFYNGDAANKQFSKKIAKLFDITRGTFSDVSILGETLNICTTNLSAGFYSEHGKNAEYIYKPHLDYTIKTVPKLVSLLGTKRYNLPFFTRYQNFFDDMPNRPVYLDYDYTPWYLKGGLK